MTYPTRNHPLVPEVWLAQFTIARNRWSAYVLKMSLDRFREALRLACVEAGTIKAWALDHDISLSYVSDVLKGNREPGDKLLTAMGWKREVIYSPLSEDK